MRLMKNNETQGNLTYFPVDKKKRQSPERSETAADEDSSISGEELLKTLEKPFQSAGRNRRIARLKERIHAGTYHVSATELAERMIDGDAF